MVPPGGGENGRVVCRSSGGVKEPGGGKRWPCLARRADMPLVVIEAEMSIMIGSPPVGMAKARGFGVKRARVPPKGATVATEGSELRISTMRPSRAGASR